MPRVTFDRDGRDFYLRVIGRKEAPPVVCVHGFGNDSTIWLPYVLPLAHKYRFYLLDLPGFGRSFHTPTRGQRFLEDYANCINATLDLIDRPAVLVGFSLGAYTSLYFLENNRTESVSKYLHIDHTPYTAMADGWSGGLNSEILQTFAKITELVEADPPQAEMPLAKLAPQIRDEYYKMLRDLGEFSVTGKIKKNINKLLHHTPVISHRVYNRAAWPWAYLCLMHYHRGTYDLRGKVSQVDLPVKVVFGRQSEIFNDVGFNYLCQHLPRVQSQVFEKSGHDLMLHEPLLFYRLLSEFLNSP